MQMTYNNLATPASVSTATRNAAPAELTAGTRMLLPMVNQWPTEAYYNNLTAHIYALFHHFTFSTLHS